MTSDACRAHELERLCLIRLASYATPGTLRFGYDNFWNKSSKDGVAASIEPAMTRDYISIVRDSSELDQGVPIQ